MTKLQKESREAEKKLLATKWKTKVCISGKQCWCRMIYPVKKIEYSEGEIMNVVGAGSISKNVAEYIVRLHNDSLQSNTLDVTIANALSGKGYPKSYYRQTSPEEAQAVTDTLQRTAKKKPTRPNRK